MRVPKIITPVATFAVALTLAVTALASFTFKATKIDAEYTLYMDCNDGRRMKVPLHKNELANVTVNAASPCLLDYGIGGVKSGNIKFIYGAERITISRGVLTRM